MTEKNDWVECPNCGAREPKGAKFCGFCGTSLEFAAHQKGGSQTNQETLQPVRSEPLQASSPQMYQEKQTTYPSAPRDDFDPNNLPPSSTEKDGNTSVAFYLSLFGFFLLLWPMGIGALYFGYKGIKNDEKGCQLTIALILGIIEILLMIVAPIILIVIIL